MSGMCSKEIRISKKNNENFPTESYEKEIIDIVPPWDDIFLMTKITTIEQEAKGNEV